MESKIGLAKNFWIEVGLRWGSPPPPENCRLHFLRAAMTPSGGGDQSQFSYVGTGVRYSYGSGAASTPRLGSEMRADVTLVTLRQKTSSMELAVI